MSGDQPDSEGLRPRTPMQRNPHGGRHVARRHAEREAGIGPRCHGRGEAVSAEISVAEHTPRGGSHGD